jgi:hypothetical protein
MSIFNDDLKRINYEFLVLARECARHQPVDAVWKFNLSASAVQSLATMSNESLAELAAGGRAVFCVLPSQTVPSKQPNSLRAALLKTEPLQQ